MKNSRGFMLAETLVVTIFVSSTLLFLFIQFSNLSKSYEESFLYNNPNELYALEDIKNYIESDDSFINYLENNIDDKLYIDITDCTLFSKTNYCKKLFEFENVETIFVSKNLVSKDYINDYDAKFLNFIKKINKEGKEKYRIVAKFKGDTYSTLRFGE